MTASRRELFKYGASIGALAMLSLREETMQRVQAAAGALGDAPPDFAARDESFWFQVQTAFQIDRAIINLNNGGVCPAPQVVLEAARRQMEYVNNIPARHLWSQLDPHVETSRAHLARHFGCSPEEMAIVRNASEALEICIYGIDLKPGDEVLTTDQDYGRMINTFKQRVAREGIVLNTPPIPTPATGPQDILEVFRKNITPKTRVMHCAHVINITGQIVPVRDIVRLGREHGIPVIVDGAHAFGHLVFSRDELE
ncbi:MAG: aminotransferase class V-fold PLP-dependent enzyme, partial [Phycisphaerales bacterium]|nr:aminotransferase class V-fold PLP-dependent enzyme [Phycisphaerales bacterium]